MTHQEKLTKVTEAIHKACPDLLEKKRNCKIIHNKNGIKEESVIIFADNAQIAVLTNDDTIIIKEFVDDGIDDLKILGQPIGIAEVLRTFNSMDHEVVIGGLPTNPKEICIDNDGLFFCQYETSLDVYWNLLKTLDQQEEPVISLLYSILCHDDNN